MQAGRVARLYLSHRLGDNPFMSHAMNPSPLITVIVPVHDVADYVQACIDSLRAQTLRDFECLVIDDGSTDDSAARARAAIGDDPRFRLIGQENRGLSGARNTGLDQARGAFIAFVDSDDRVMPDYLLRLWQTLDETGCDWVACAVRFCQPDGSGQTHSAIHGASVLADHQVPRRFAFGDWCDVIRHFPSAWNKLYRASLIDGLRFDEGVWFEDHGFFQRAALRTDHLMYLPEALYLQTQGRPGQITDSDDDRVFDQFDVLDRIRATLQGSTRPGAITAFARLASRLLFERSIALRDPDRRARFAAEAASYLGREGIAFSPDWDPEIARSFALEMAGTLPLSVVLCWNGQAEAPLRESLGALAALRGPGREVLVICSSRGVARTALAGDLFGARVIVQPVRGLARARNHGLIQARGQYVVFLNAGDRPAPLALLNWCETMFRADADFGLSSFRTGPGPTAPVNSGFLDDSLLPGGRPPRGLMEITPQGALNLEPQTSAKIARRDFLLEQGLFFVPGLHSESVFCISAAVQARRVVCTPWPGIELASSPRRAFVLPTTLWRSQALLGRALPGAVAAALPEGWQRRLFARVLRAQVHQTVGLSRMRRGLILTGAALTALRYRFGRQSGAPAGLDPSEGLRLPFVFDPIGLVRRSLLARRIVTDAPLSARSTAHDGLRMHHFPLTNRGVFRFRADFQTAPNANVSFYGARGATIPFHLSVRQTEGLVVCNDFHGGWGVERKTHMALALTGVDVTIELAPPHVTVWIDGARICRFGPPKLRRRSGIRELGTITALGLQGGIYPFEMLPHTPQPGQILLDPRLNLCIGLPPGETADCMRLRICHDGSDVALFSVDGGRGAIAVIQGYLWQNLPADAPLRLEVRRRGATPWLFEIPRAEMADRLGALLQTELSPGEDTALFNVLEHLRHGGFLGHLPRNLQERAHRLARNAGLARFLLPPGSTDTGPPPLAPLQDTETAELDVALAQFIQTQRANPAGDALAFLRGIALPSGPKRGLFMALSEYFSMPGRDFDGFARLAEGTGLPYVNLPEDRWSLSATLPFLLCAGRLDDLVTAMQRLAELGDGWVLTPPLAWVVRRVMDIPDIDPWTREKMLYAFMAFVDNRRADYWERIHCRELTRAAVAMLAFHGRASHYLQRDIELFCLRAYGLSRLFWQLTDDSAVSLPARLEIAKERFGDLAPGAAPETLERALRLFAKADCGDAPRAGREWLGPKTAAQSRGADRHAFGSEAEENLLRFMAFPGGAPLDRLQADRVTQGFAGFYPLVPQAPNFALQRSVGAELAGLLMDPLSPPDALWMDGLIQRLGALAAKSSGYLGFALGLAMVTGLSEQPGQAATLARLQDWLIARTHALTPADRQELFKSPAVRTALVALRNSTTETGTALLHALAQQADLILPAPGPAGNAGLPAPSPLFDAIVVVFSCVPNLETRIPAMRAGWLGQLAALGIPYVVVVGNGDGQRRGDVLHLDAPDDYEGLPRKTLATLKWVHDNTRFGHLVKIDDDCFLNVALFFHALTYRKFDYYGRQLTREPGQMDRAWHQDKSTSLRGRLTLDKSPEPSSYADGGSGYALSRHAMARALATADSSAGRQLIALSFMEDKLLGDLLSFCGIHVVEEDYRIAIRRRTHRDALPVAAWHNSFFASKAAPLQMVHLDTHHDQAGALAQLDANTLCPPKIWPTFQQAKLGYQSNALELISDIATVEAACNAEVAVVACMRNEMFMLPHFLAHYRRLGVGAFLIADNCSNDGTLEYLAAQPDVALFSVDTEYRLSHYGVAWQQAMLAAFRMGKWSLVADADELLVWQTPQRETLPALLARPEFATAEAVRLFMLDMYPKGGLSKATFASGDPFAEAGFADRVPFLTSAPMRGPFSDQPAWTSALRHRLIPGSRPNLFTAQKLALLRYHPFMRLSEGMHFVGDVRLADRELIFAHFKYSAEFRTKAQTEVARQQHFNDAEEYRKYLDLASEGRDVIYDPELSVPWADSPFVRARLDPA